MPALYKRKRERAEVVDGHNKMICKWQVSVYGKRDHSRLETTTFFFFSFFPVSVFFFFFLKRPRIDERVIPHLNRHLFAPPPPTNHN